MLKMEDKRVDGNNTVNLLTEKFGNLCIGKENIITFENGMLGFEELKQYVIVDIEECLPFEWLVSVKDPLVAFPILNPTPFFSDYNPMKYINDMQSLLIKDKKNVEIFCTVTLGNNPSDITINLKGPVIINMENKKGKQFVVSEDYYSLHHPIVRS